MGSNGAGRVAGGPALRSDCVGGVDEAGRGPLAGPVVAAVVLLPAGRRLPGVTDSKQLSARRRAELAELIRREAVAWSVASATVAEIDRLNILQASLLAMRRAVERLPVWPAQLRVDGLQAPRLPGYPGRVETLVRGDQRCPAIAAASILAKLTRDAELLALDQRYPAYGFAQHKGYPTAAHRAALRRHGPCPAHRRSFRPVQAALAAQAESA